MQMIEQFRRVARQAMRESALFGHEFGRQTAMAFAVFAGLWLPMADRAFAFEPDERAAIVATGDMTIDLFLDRLMMAESGGRDTAKNPLSTAVGPYQFINATFLDVVRRQFGQETAGMSEPQILALRMDRTFARRAAAVYTVENARQLEAADVPATYPNLRLAFLLGPAGALRVLQSPGNTPVAPLLGAAVIKANPFMQGMTAAGLIARAGRDLRLPASEIAAAPSAALRAKLASVIVPTMAAAAATKANVPKKVAPKIDVRCNLVLPSCRRWFALQTQALARRQGAPRRMKAASLR